MQLIPETAERFNVSACTTSATTCAAALRICAGCWPTIRATFALPRRVQRRREGRRQVPRHSALCGDPRYVRRVAAPVRQRDASLCAGRPAFAGHQTPIAAPCEATAIRYASGGGLCDLMADLR